MGYDFTDRGFGVNRITAGANFVLKAGNCTSLFRVNYEHYFNNSMDMSALFKTVQHNSDKFAIEYLLVF